MTTAESNEASILVSSSGGLGRITLNRPRAINALDHEMVLSITDVLRRWVDDSDVHTVLLTGAGERGLCAGGDVRALRTSIIEGRPEEAEAFFRDEYAMNLLIAQYPKPIVAIADGVTMGGGIGLAGHAAVRVVTERSKLAMPETRIGFTPDVGGTHILGAAPGRLGEYLGLTGAVMDGSDAILAGFADHFVPSERLDSLIDALQNRADPGTPAELVLLFDETPDPGPLAAAQAWIDDAFALDSVADIQRRLREIGGDAAIAADTLDELSPTSLVVTLAAVRAARASASLPAALQREFDLGAFLAARPDMPEGIRAQLVDKDRSPKWSPATIADVPAELADEALAFRAERPLTV